MGGVAGPRCTVHATDTRDMRRMADFPRMFVLLLSLVVFDLKVVGGGRLIPSYPTRVSEVPSAA
jgi:hypothetical protein